MTPTDEQMNEPICSWCRGNHFLADCPKVKEDLCPEPTLFQCKIDKSKCEHEWPDNVQDHDVCLKCGQNFLAYAFMEAP